MEQTLAERRRNADLRALGGMDHAGQVPKPWTMSRFLSTLGQEPFRVRLQEVFDQMARQLGEAVPSLGEHLAGDPPAAPGAAQAEIFAPSSR